MVTNLLVAQNFQSTLVEALRDAFASNTDFPWNEDDEITTIGIYSQYPRVMPPYPCIIVRDPAVDNLPRCFGNDLVREVYGERNIDGITLSDGLCFQIFGGACQMDSEITVIGNTNPERRLILDYVNTYLRFTKREVLQDQGIDITDIDLNSDGIEIYGASLLETSSLRLSSFVTWEYVSQDMEVIRAVEMDSLGIINPDGTTFYS